MTWAERGHSGVGTGPNHPHPRPPARPSQHNGKGRGEERRGWFRVQRIRTKVAKKPRCFPSLLLYPLSDQRQQMASVECPFHYCASVGRGRRRGRDSTNIVASSFSDAATEGRLILGRSRKGNNLLYLCGEIRTALLPSTLRGF